MLIKRLILLMLAALALTGPSFAWNIDATASSARLRPYKLLNQVVSTIHTQALNLNTQVLQLALKAYIKASQHSKNIKQILTIIDYSKPSTARRLWVIDLKHRKVLYNTWVTHGKNSGALRANSFSNKLGSLKSSIGVFLTEKTYIGSVGYALRLHGLESGFNDNAYRRSVVFHGAWYADPGVLSKYSYLGRSYGCPAVSNKIAKNLINTIKNHALVFAYYPDQKWLKQSMFLV